MAIPEGYRVLQDIGTVGLERTVEFALLEADFGDGYGASALTGSTEGTRSWKLVWRGVHSKLPMIPSDITGDLLDRVNYLWRFYCDQMAAANAPFIITDPVDRQQYLVRFADRNFTQQQFRDALFYSFGVKLKQARVPGFSFGAVQAANPDQI